MNQNRLNLSKFNVERLNRWLNQNQLNALEEAYQGAKTIQSLEEQYNNGSKIAYTPDQSKAVFDYFKSLCDRQLLRVRLNLTQFRLGGFLLNQQQYVLDYPSSLSEGTPSETTASPSPSTVELEIVKKLSFIDSVVGKYRQSEDDFETVMALDPQTTLAQSIRSHSPASEGKSISPTNPAEMANPALNLDSISKGMNQSLSGDRSNRWFLGWRRVRQELTPDYEQQVIQELRLRRKQNQMALRWLAILIVVPIAIQLLTKNLVFEPMLGDYSNKHPERIELNREVREEFFTEYTQYKETLEIQQLLGIAPILTQEQYDKQLREKALELWRESREHALRGLKNVLADLVALVIFVAMVFFNRDKLIALRRFTNRSFLNLGDPTKVFVFIFVTDVFVGFHSVEGWDVILGSVFYHFGLPENLVLIKGFIATVPVFLDSCIKFWIFTYLTRYSPSTSAIYERMNT